MTTRRGKAPSYRHHKPTGRAFVQYKRRAIYLGRHGTRASTEAYERFLVVWRAVAAEPHQPLPRITSQDLTSAEAFERLLAQLAPGSGESPPAPAPHELTIVELVDRYWQHAQQFYQRHDPYAQPTHGAAENGEPAAAQRIPTSTIKNQKPALRRLNQLYGSTPAAKFGPLSLKALRKTWASDGLSIKTVNSYSQTIKGVFRWAASEELIPVGAYEALRTVRGLARGRGEARETEPVAPVADTIVEATLPHLPPVVADMVRFQRLTGCRPSEVCTLRPCDVERFASLAERPLPLFDHPGGREEPAPRELDVWEYRPAHHKTKHKSRQRLIPIGPRAKEILRPYLLKLAFTPAAFCFQPPAESPRAKDRPGLGRYTKDTYARAVRRACEVAFNMPEQLREPALRKAAGRVTAAELARLRKEAAAWRARHCWSPNQLRHSAATAIRQRYGLEAAQVVLGHSEADTTQIYAAADWAKAVEIAREVG